MNAASLVQTLVLAVFLTTDAVAGQQTVAEARCEASGVRITYRDGRTSIVALDAAAGQTCSDLRISTDRRHVGWLRQWEEAERQDGRIVDLHSANELFVDGKVVADAPLDCPRRSGRACELRSHPARPG